LSKLNPHAIYILSQAISGRLAPNLNEPLGSLASLRKRHVTLFERPRPETHAMNWQRVNEFIRERNASHRSALEFLEFSPTNAISECRQLLALPVAHRRACFDNEISQAVEESGMLVTHCRKNIQRKLTCPGAELND